MSLEAISLVRSLPRRGIHLTPRDRFVLYALADYSDDEYRAWPSHRTITEWTGYARATVQEALDSLEEAGFITSEQRHRDDGGFTSKVYRINPPAQEPGTPARHAGTPLPENRAGPITQIGHPPAREPGTKTPHKEPPMNPHKEPEPKTSLAIAEPTPQAAAPSDFLDAWNQHRGNLPSAQAMNDFRRTRISRLRKEHGDRALALFTAATIAVSQNDFWVENQYGFDNLLRGKVLTYAEQHANTGGMSAGDRKLATTADAIFNAIGGR